MGKKRGQATVFIILGLVIVVFIGILFYVKQDLVKQKIEELGFKGTVVPERVQTVVFYVDSCLISLGKDGLNIMGRQGGYIELPNEFKYNNQMYLQVDEFSKNPYWLSRYGSKIPTNEFMEGQLKQYIEDNFDKCNLDSFTGIGYKFSIKDLDVSVTINKEDVGIRLNSDFDTKIGEDVFSLKDYIDGKIDVPLGRILDLGKKIVDTETKDGSLEFNTINLIAAYSHDKNAGIPPMAGVDFDCTKKVWAESVVEERLKEMLTENLIYLNIPDAGSAYTGGKELFFNNMDWDINDNFNDLEVNFKYYPEWGMNLDIYPKNGGLLESSNLGLMTWVMTFCMNMYNFRYDIRYPILVEFVGKNDYVFQFPIEVDVVDNYKRERLFSIEEDSKKTSLLCDLNQRDSGLIKINTFDGLNGKELDNVDILYECGPDSCSIGSTEKTISGSFLNTRFPSCYNGILNLYKEGYSGDRKLLSTEHDKGDNIDITLEPIRTKKVRAEVMVNGYRRGLNNDEGLFVDISKKNIELGGYDYSFASEIKKEGSIELVPGSYDVSLVLFTNKKITLPAEKFSYTTVWPLKKTVEIPEQSFDGLMLGKNNFEWSVDKNDLDNNNQIVFIIKANDIPNKYSELEELYKEEEDYVTPEYE